ncbi:MAG: uroporphyrinogen decarboxylase [Magnetococcales bacterium]|nr:uroporphyrinogen decarboxylase [Magnetococcales bacterium]
MKNRLFPQHRFVQACFSRPVDQTPIWIMRQAGRYLPEYRQVRSQAGNFLTLCKTPSLAAEVTLQPIRRFGFDAAILFSDILVVPEAMGIKLSFSDGEGPMLDPPIRCRKDIEHLKATVNPDNDLDYVMEAIERIRSLLQDQIPLIGFSGSPWTLATYMVEGGSSKDFGTIRKMMYNNPSDLLLLLEQLTTVVTDYLNAQIRHGVQAIQIFDTWGSVLPFELFQTYSLNFISTIIAGLHRVDRNGLAIPVIVFSKGCGHRLKPLMESDCDVIGLDWGVDLGKARRQVKGRVALQGNMDPAVLYAPQAVIRAETKKILHRFGPHPGHIFNLGHGITPDVEPEQVATLVKVVREESRAS